MGKRVVKRRTDWRRECAKLQVEIGILRKRVLSLKNETLRQDSEIDGLQRDLACRVIDAKRLNADLNTRITESKQMHDNWMSAHWELRAIIEPILVDLGMPPWNRYRSFMQLRENIRTRISTLTDRRAPALCDVAPQPMAHRHSVGARATNEDIARKDE